MNVSRNLEYPFLLVILALSVLLGVSCSEKKDNTLGMILLPEGMEGSAPQRMELHRALDVQTLHGETPVKGIQNTVLAGHRSGYELRTLLNFRVDIPSDAVVLAVRLQLYVIRTRGDLPVDLSIHRLERDFEETEVTFELAAEGEPWSTPGGDYVPAPLAETSFQGSGIDTVSVGLDSLQIAGWLPGRQNLPLIVLANGGDQTMIEFLAREGFPTSPTASRLEIIFRTSSVSGDQLLDRRAFMDATIVRFEGQVDPQNLSIGALPASQTFFRYDFSDVPRYATINQALMHLRMVRAAFVDSFLVAAYLRDDVSYVSSDETQLGYSTVLGEGDAVLVLDVTSVVQKAVLGGGTSGSYIALGSQVNATTAGFVEFYPPTAADSTLRPYISVIYSGLPGLAEPVKPGTELK